MRSTAVRQRLMSQLHAAWAAAGRSGARVAVASCSYAGLLQPGPHDGVHLLAGACKSLCAPWRLEEGAAAARDQLSSCIKLVLSCAASCCSAA